MPGAGLERALDRGPRRRTRDRLHEFEVLPFLATSSDHSLPMLELRRRTPLSQSRVSRVVSGLEARGLVARETDPTDTRAVTVVLTRQGLATFETTRPRHQANVDEHLLAILDDTELRQLSAITTKLLRAWSAPASSGG